jgi:hypothetical protein
MSLRGARFLARHCEPPIDSGAKQSRLFSVCFLRKCMARNRLRNLFNDFSHEIASLPSVARNDENMREYCVGR